MITLGSIKTTVTLIEQIILTRLSEPGSSRKRSTDR